MPTCPHLQNQLPLLCADLGFVDGPSLDVVRLDSTGFRLLRIVRGFCYVLLCFLLFRVRPADAAHSAEITANLLVSMLDFDSFLNFSANSCSFSTYQ